VLDLPPERRIRLQQAADDGVRLHGGSDQAQAPRRVLAVDELSGKERLTQDTEIELAGLGLADDNIAAAKSELSTRRMSPSRAISGEYAVYRAGP
jgi:hypothetical protein